MSQNQTLIDCLAKTGQDQYLKLSPQKACFIFKNIFLTRNIVSSPQANIRGRNSVSPSRHSVFSDPPIFKTCNWKLTPQQRQVYRCLTQCGFISHRHNKERAHSGTIRLTHPCKFILTPPVMCWQQLLV